ncbi:hypothetical protein EPA93_44175 [Ktedonosporobacter rubrisoli]|uniref:Uncharacterized protein n=1 Tax=Ktedonosporobacter rubrisoli TaxID=2509675 RepID=A0A4P6K374_KTERU|nr:hypothetical protein [Ktedonosporobacter rubrisoli]QBD82594.1 hypothetical protein EPA93_44175 [Ktedonosporobacter rubrisoli]
MLEGNFEHTLPIRLELRQSQLGLVSQLKQLFQVFVPDLQDTARNYYYYVALDLTSDQALVQAAFLHQHHICYTDLFKQREEFVQACFQDIDINGILIHTVACETDSQGQLKVYLIGKEREKLQWSAWSPSLQGEDEDEQVYIAQFPASWLLHSAWKLEKRGR